MIKKIKEKVLGLKIKENIKDILSKDELKYLKVESDEDILKKVNKYISSNIENYDLSRVVHLFLSDLDNFETYNDCLDYYIEKDSYLNQENKQDRVDDFIDELYKNNSFVKLVKRDYLKEDSKLF